MSDDIIVPEENRVFILVETDWEIEVPAEDRTVEVPNATRE